MVEGFRNRQTHRGVLRGVIIACERLPVFHMRIKRISSRSRAARSRRSRSRGELYKHRAGSGAQSYVNLRGEGGVDTGKEARQEKQDGGNGGGGGGRRSVIPANESLAPFVLKQQLFSAFTTFCGFTSYKEVKERHI